MSMERVDKTDPLTPSAIVMELLGKVGEMKNVVVVWLHNDGFTHIVYSDAKFAKIVGQLEYAKWTLCRQFNDIPDDGE